MPRKWTIFIICLVVIVTGFAVRGPLVSTFFEWYLKGYCRTCLGSRLTYQNLYHENGQWVFENPVLTTKSRLEQGGFRCQAERATVTLSVSWLERSLALNVEVESPHIDVGSEAKELKEVFTSSTHPFRFFDVHTAFSAPQGTILVHDFSEENLVTLPLFYSIDLACRDKSEGCASIWIGTPTKDSRDLFAVLSEKDANTSQLDIDFHNVNFPSFHQTIRGLWPQAAQLEISKGTLSGNLIVTLPKNGNSYAEGRVTINDLIALHPETSSELSIPELTLHLSPKEVIKHNQVTFNTVGHLEISPLTHLVISKNSQPFWTVDEISGNLSFQSGAHTTFLIDGLISSNERQRKLHIDGFSLYQEKDNSGLNIDILFDGEHSEDNTTIRFSSKQPERELTIGKLELTCFGNEELSLLQHLFGRDYPVWQQLRIAQGIVNASAQVLFKGKNISEVNVNNITANDLAFDFPPWSLASHVKRASGSLSFNLIAPDPFKTLCADLNIQQGMLNLEGLDQTRLQFSNIQSHLSVRQGLIHKSLLEGTIAGLKGKIILDGVSPGPLATLNFSGPIKELSLVLPEVIRQGLDKEFQEGYLTITAGADRYPEGLFLTGKLFVEGVSNKDDEIAFGFALEKASPGLWNGWSPPKTNTDYTHQTYQETQPSIVPALAASAHVIYQHLIENESSLGDFIIKNGWFSGSNLPLEKYVSPFIFQNNQMSLTGIGNFQGNFNEKNLVIHYDAENIILENDDFCIELPSIARESDLDPSWPATYVFNFDNRHDSNTFPIRNGTYFEKNTGLLFTEIDSDVKVKNDTAHFTPITAFSNGLYFGGSAELDWSVPGEGIFDVRINATEMHGKVSELQHYLSHLKGNNPLLKIPIEGHVSLQQQPSTLNFSFRPGKYELQSLIHGKLTDGVIKGETTDISLQELGMNVDYNHAADTVLISDVQGTVLVGRPNHIEEYAITADQIEFTDYKKSEMQFDVWISDRKRDLIRVAGKTRSVLNQDNVPQIVFDFDHAISHFGKIHPKNFQMALKDWSQLEMLQLQFEFQLDTVLTDLQKFSRTGLFFLSRSWLKEINDISSAGGNFITTLNYDGGRSVLDFYVTGEDALLGTHHFKQFLLSGKKRSNLWSIDHMQFDDLSTAFDIIKEGMLWNINFLGIRVSDSLLLGIEGQYRDDDAHLAAKINLFEADLAGLSQWPTLQKLLQSQIIAGEVRATGNIHADFDKSLPNGMRCDVKMNGSIKNGEIKGLSLQSIENLFLHYNSDENSLKVSLREGTYHILGSHHPIKSCIMDWNPAGIRIGGEYPYKSNLFRFDAYCNAPEFDSGELILSDITSTPNSEITMPLMIHWSKDPQMGLCIQKAMGTLCGMQFDLVNSPPQNTSPNLLSLVGKIDIDLRRAAVITEGKLNAGITNWEFGDGYTLTGQWNLLKNGEGSILDNISFQGDLLVRDFELLGYRFYDWSAHLTYSPNAAYIRNMAISDLCGTMQIREMDFIQNNGEWRVSLPLLGLREFCPTLLRLTKPSSSRMAKSLNVRQMEIRDLQGILGNRNSFTGVGQLSFINPPKKNLQHTIFAVPAELLTRIGLDLAVLTPVRGTIFYEIKNGKALITRFKDIYSKGRASKFYLPHNGYESYVDFDGNLHLQVRMKQYNLIFKLAELFTVTVQGTLSNPSYSLQKQQERHEERSLKEIVQSK